MGHMITTNETDTYGQWLRRQPRDTLTTSQRDLLEEAEAWEAAHPVEVGRLDRLVGRVVALREAMTPIGAGLVEHPRGEAPCRIPSRYGKGTTFRVVARLRDRLLARRSGERRGMCFMLRREWLLVVR